MGITLKNFQQTRQKLEKLGDRVEHANRIAVSQSALFAQRRIQELLLTYQNSASNRKDYRGHEGTQSSPDRVTGTLARSIKTEVRRLGFTKYVALVGPTVIYGRAVELGGKNNKPYPYVAPVFRELMSSGILYQEYSRVLKQELRMI